MNAGKIPPQRDNNCTYDHFFILVVVVMAVVIFGFLFVLASILSPFVANSVK